MVHDFRVSRVKLPAFQVLQLFDRDGNHELARRVLHIRCQRVRFGHLNHQIGLTQSPATGKHRHRGQCGRIPFEAAFLMPLSDFPNFIRRQAAILLEITVSGYGRPGGHESFLNDLDNLLGSFFDISIALQREWAHFPRAMTGDAFLKDDRGNIGGKREDPCRKGRIVRGRSGGLRWGVIDFRGGFSNLRLDDRLLVWAAVTAKSETENEDDRE